MSDEDTREFQEAKWWSVWRQMDYSWQGLAAKQWSGWIVTEDGVAVDAETGIPYGAPPGSTPVARIQGRQANLQDYWRADVATGRLRSDNEMGTELIRREPGSFSPAAGSDETYHCAHLPLDYADGTSTAKRAWAVDRLDDIVEPRIRIAATLSPRADFESAANLDGGIWLRAPAKVSEGSFRVSYHRAAFVNRTDFSERQFDEAWFRSTLFLQECIFKSAIFKTQARFFHAVFMSFTSFEKAIFEETCEMGSVIFFGRAVFREAVFAEFNCIMSLFGDKANFQGAKFSAIAALSEATFRGGAVFSKAQFERGAFFSGARFRLPSEFGGAVFNSMLKFGEANFESIVAFDNISWPDDEADCRDAFSQCLFQRGAVFSGAGCKRFSAFNGAHFERGLTLDQVSPRASDRQFRKELKAAGPEGMAALEGGCRVLKQAMERVSDKAREQLFYRYELIARRKRPGIPASEKAFSLIYAWTSNYGTSFGRPLLALLGTILGFATIYWLMQVGAGGALKSLASVWFGRPIEPHLREALSFSFSRVFPFGAFEDVSKIWLDGFETSDTIATLGVRILASLQSAFAIVLVFVLSLAIRRKFQIS